MEQKCVGEARRQPTPGNHHRRRSSYRSYRGLAWINITKGLRVISFPFSSLYDSAHIWRVKALSVAFFMIVALLSRPTGSQQRRQNAIDEMSSEWEEAEEDQQCEMVVKCKPAKTAASSSSSIKTTGGESAPETSTYRVPLKPYGAPFNPMSEGGSVMWQKMGATPKSTAASVGKKSKMTTTTESSGRSDNNVEEKKVHSFFGRKKTHKGKSF